MSIHSSLARHSKGRMHRSVFKRFERLGILKEKNAWGKDSSIFGLPKVKSLKIKVKKEKAVKETTAAAPAAGAGAKSPAASETAAKGKQK